MGFAKAEGSDLYYEEKGQGVPIAVERNAAHPHRGPACGADRDAAAGLARPSCRAVERFPRFAYSYRAGGTAWDAFPAEWRRIARENARPSLADIRIAIGNYPTAKDLATITSPIVCTNGARSSETMVRITRSLARAIPAARVREIPGAGHAAAFDAPAAFVQVILVATQ